MFVRDSCSKQLDSDKACCRRPRISFQKNAQWQAGTGSVCRLLRGAGDGAKRAKVRRGVILGCVRFSVAGKTAAESVAFGNERAVLFHLIMPRAGSRHWIGWQDKA
jgi:hypothetical protein